MDFAPTIGHEQTGLRPAVVISKDNYNKYTGLAVICPITTNTKKFFTHYELINTKKVKGSVLCEHVRSIDFKARKLSFVEKISEYELEEIIDIVNGIIEIKKKKKGQGHVCPIHTRIINHHVYKHTYRPQYTCSEENTVSNVQCGSCCQFR